jgi:hypothetical protein
MIARKTEGNITSNNGNIKITLIDTRAHVKLECIHLAEVIDKETI